MFEQNGRKWALSQYYHSKDHYHKDYIKCLSRPHRKILKSIPAGLAYVSEANAVYIHSLAGEVVIASESLEKFYYFMSIALYGDEFSIPLIDRCHAIIIAIRIMLGSESLDFDLDPRGTLPSEIERGLGILVRHQMQFTFGHEYAHLLCKHIPSPQSIAKKKQPDVHSAHLKDIRIFSYEMEYEADLYALRNIQKKDKVYSQISQGAFSVLLYLNFLEKTLDELGLKKFSISMTHPSPLDRIKNLQRRLGKKVFVSERQLEFYLNILEEMKDTFIYQVKDNKNDVLTSYGSVYLPSYKSKIKQDRYDF